MRALSGPGLVVALLFLTSGAAGQGGARSIGPQVRPFVAVDAPVVALTHLRLIDGTGGPAREEQTIVITGERITTVGPAATTVVPAGAHVIDLAGHTVIPGLIGLHDHMYYSSVGGSMKPMFFSYPKLFLASGVTTIRTTGSVDSYQELNHHRAIEAGEIVGPDIFVTGPYLQGPGPGPFAMHPLSGPEDARRMVRYWAEEGVPWFKAYTQITRAELGAAIDEAHKHHVKVTAHLCSVGFREAVALGIDNLEHGLLTNTEYWSGKKLDACPTIGDSVVYENVDIDGPAVQQTFREMVKHRVAMTSTLAVMELSAASRVPPDARVLDALFPEARSSLEKWYGTGRQAKDSLARSHLTLAMAYERAFVKAGGLLGAGSDPCCLSAIAGYADQRNFELLMEAGFTGEQSIQIMTANGAKILGVSDRVGTVVAGKQADLVVLRGDLGSTPSVIREVTMVFRKGIGYDPGKLTEAVKGKVGIR